MADKALKSIIKKIKAVYAEHDDIDDIVADLKGNSYIDYWADKFCSEDFSHNKELARELFEIALEQEDIDLVDIANKLSDPNGYDDKVWAAEIFKLALEKAEDFNDKLSICASIAQENGLNDKEWGTKLAKELENDIEELSQYNQFIVLLMEDIQNKEWATKFIKKATTKLLEAEDIFSFAGFSDEIINLGKHMSSKDGANDKEAAKNIFDLIKQYEGITDLLDGARVVKEIYGDDDYSTSYVSEVLDKAIEFVQEGYYCDIYYFIKDELEDNDRAEEYKDNYYDEMQSDHDEYESCEELFGSNDDDEEDIDIDDIDFDNYDDEKSIIAFSTEEIISSTIEEDMYDEDGNLPDEAYGLISEKLSEFISEVKDKFEGNIENKILIYINGQLKEFKASIITKDIEDFDYLYLYMILSKDVPADDINALFLNLSDYGFYAMYQNNGEAIIQGYDYGEYNTGYFSDPDGRDEYYIDKFTEGTYSGFYKEAQNKLIND